MKPEVCKNCCAKEFIEQSDAYVCAYCDTRYEKPAKPAAAVAVQVPSREVVFEETVVDAAVKPMREKNKWIALLFWLFLGVYGGHKFYEGRVVMGIVYLLTAGLFGIGWIVDFFILLFKPNPYYV